MLKALLKIAMVMAVFVTLNGQAIAWVTAVPCDDKAEISLNGDQNLPHSTSIESTDDDDCCDPTCCDLNCMCLGSACSLVSCSIVDTSSVATILVSNVKFTPPSEQPNEIPTLLYRPPILAS